MRVLFTGLTALLIIPFITILNPFLRRLLDPVSFNPNRGLSPGITGALLSFGFSIATIILFIKNRRLGDRSLISWAGFFPALLVACFWIFMIVGEILFPH